MYVAWYGDHGCNRWASGWTVHYIRGWIDISDRTNGCYKYSLNPTREIPKHIQLMECPIKRCLIDSLPHSRGRLVWDWDAHSTHQDEKKTNRKLNSRRIIWFSHLFCCKRCENVTLNLSRPAASHPSHRPFFSLRYSKWAKFWVCSFAVQVSMTIYNLTKLIWAYRTVVPSPSLYPFLHIHILLPLLLTNILRWYPW